MPELRHCVCGKDYWFPGERWQHKDCVVTAPVVTQDVVTQVSRQVRWQRENKDRYNEKMREYRRKRRMTLAG